MPQFTIVSIIKPYSLMNITCNCNVCGEEGIITVPSSTTLEALVAMQKQYACTDCYLKYCL